MNYRHAYHAGNFADVMKHVVLVRVLHHLLKKDAPFRVVDTHAGTGLYDLAGEEAGRTGEWRLGVGRLEAPFEAKVEAMLSPFRDVLHRVRERHGPTHYPGSPLIAAEMLRRQDRAVFVELHPVDGALLAERCAPFQGVKVLALDGWTALNALIPPKERRGLVLIDPPYEERGELDRLAAAVVKAVRKWQTGLLVAWYPIKDAAEIAPVADRLADACPRPMLRLELVVDRADNAGRLNGSGLFVVNPPWTLAGEMRAVLPALAERLSRGGYGAYRCEETGGRS